MTEITFIHRIEAPELSAALNNLAEAIKGRSFAAPTASVAPATPAPVVPEKPVETPTAPIAARAAANPTVAPVTAPVNGDASATINAPIAQAPTPATNTAPAPVPAATSKVYTFDDITTAGSQLLEQGKMNQLMELLKGYGVQAVTQLKPEQYADVAAGLRGLGANI